MKAPSLLLAAAALLSLVFSAAPLRAAGAASSVTLSNVHLCCEGCVDGVNDTVAAVPGASADADKDAKTIVVTADDKATLQKAVDALVAAGYYGRPSDPSIHVAATTAPDATVHGLKVSGVHLCCKKCVAQLNKAVGKVRGVTGTTATKNAKSFAIQGDFNARDVAAALNQAGFAAQVVAE